MLSISAILLAVVEKLAIALSVKKIEKIIPSQPLKYLRGPKRWAYLRDLESTLERMPFIYRRLKTEVLNDYVEFTSQSLDIDTLSEKSSTSLIADNRIAALRFNDLLRGSKKVLFLGDAGMGKSTFQRYSVLKLLKGKPQFVNPKEKLLPFFVPLKVVPNHQPYPILSHLLSRTRLLAGKRGLHKLIRLANKQQLFLLLDGYDEIQSAGTESGRNYIREELDTMMKSKPFSVNLTLPKSPSAEDFYKALAGCRIWLSSRKAFFKDYPIKIGDVVKSPGVQVLELRGIGENRVRLVKNIFDRYRERSEQAELFDERYFITQVDEAPDSELSAMSSNPLWLTVMCYTYATNVIEKEDYQIQAASNFYDLIGECLSLLLKDIDKAKVRDLRPVEQEVLSIDRNRYIPEKKAFLEYFAAQLFCAEEAVKTIFGFDYLQEKVVSYFEAHNQSPNTQRILNSLGTVKTSNFAVQLIYSGVFVIVDKKEQKEFYDFPHMRFREVLAANYFNQYGFKFLLDNLAKPGVSELLYVFFNRSRSQEAILRELFAAVLKAPGDEYYQSLISNCLRKSPDGYFPSQELLTEFFSKCIENDSSFRLPTPILTKFQFTEDVSRMLSRGFKKSLSQQKPNALFLCCTLLARYNKPLLQELSYFILEQLDKRSVIAMQACLAFPDLFDGIKNSQKMSLFVRHFVYLKNHIKQIIKANDDIPLPDDKNQTIQECHIFTEEVLQKLHDRLMRKPFSFDEAMLTNLRDIKDRVVFSSDYLKFVNVKNLLIAKRIQRYSSLDYEMYREVMHTIKSFPHNPLSKLKFFDKDAYLGELIPEKISAQRSKIIDESKPFSIKIGGNELTLTIDNLKEGFNAVESFNLPAGGASVPIKMEFENDRILFDVAIYDDQQTLLCKIVRNDWKFNPKSSYACIAGAKVFEIIDADGIPVIQINVTGANEIEIGGYLSVDYGYDTFTPEATAFGGDKTVAKGMLKRLFAES